MFHAKHESSAPTVKNTPTLYGPRVFPCDIARVTNGAHNPIRMPDTMHVMMLFLVSELPAALRLPYALPSSTIAMTAHATPESSSPALPFGRMRELDTTPTANAVPMDTGNAIATSAMSM